MSTSAPASAQPWASGRTPTVPPPGPGGYVDANSCLGEWPSRRLTGSPPADIHQQVEQRLRLMDRLDIRRAAVSRLEGVWFKDSGVANAELHTMVGHLADRFFPVYTLNPTFPAWQEHLARCVDDYGLAPGRGAIRLHPSYHGYRLDDSRVDGCLDRLARLYLPVVLTIQLEDARMQHPAMRAPDLGLADVVALLSRWPQIRWVIAAAVHSQILAVGTQVPAEAHVWFDISRVQGPIDGIPILSERLGSRRLLFGTNLPLHVPESPVLELADAHLPPDEDAAIRHGNARQALGIT